MRPLLLLAFVAGCPDPVGVDTSYPDACRSVVGQFQLAAPKDNQTYPASLEVYVNESERWAAYNVSMVDSFGTSYTYTSDGYKENPDPSWWALDNFHYELAPGRRYTVTISTCDEMQSATFFTQQ